jgi:hypothetical protein
MFLNKLAALVDDFLRNGLNVLVVLESQVDVGGGKVVNMEP